MVVTSLSLAYPDNLIMYSGLLYTNFLTGTLNAQGDTNSIRSSSTNLSDGSFDDLDGFERMNNGSFPYFSPPLRTSNMSSESNLANTIHGNGSSVVNTLSSSSARPGALQIPFTGLMGYQITPDIAKLFGLNDTTYAVLVTEIEAGSPAEKAGIRGGNIITTVDGEQIKVGGDIILEVDGNTSYVRNDEVFQNFFQNEKKAGDVVTLTILQDGMVKDVRMKIGAMPLFFWYDNREEGVKMNYPSDWRVSEAGPSKRDIVKFFSPEGTVINASSLPVAGVFVAVIPSDLGLDSVARNEQEDTEDTRNLDMFLTEISGLPAYERVYYDYSNADRTLKILTVFTIKDDQLYRITFAADPSRYDDYISLARKIIDSFQFTK
jgi:hypothetical protein